MVSRLLLLVVVLSGCAQTKYYRTDVDYKLLAYVQNIEEYYNIKIDYPVKLGKLKDDTLGMCHKTDGLVIDADFYKYGTPDNLEEVILHEFGHCSFKRGHEREFFTEGLMDGCATTVMTPSHMISDTNCWRKFKRYYYDELRP
jgi:hypothetical protein